MEHIAETIRREFKVTKRVLRKATAIELVRTARNQGQQELGYQARPFVLCGLPVKRPPEDLLKFSRRNGRFTLSIVADPEWGLPWGQDRLTLLWCFTEAVRRQSPVIRFRAAADILRTFGLPQTGQSYRRLTRSFERLFGATIYFGIEDETRDRAARMVDRVRLHFIRRLRLWYGGDVRQASLPGGEFENAIELSAELYEELSAHPIPVDMGVVRALKDSSGCLDLYVFLVWRCFVTRSRSRIPLHSLAEQLGSVKYSSHRAFKQQIKRWLGIVKAIWPECPAKLEADMLVLRHGRAIAPRRPGPGPPKVFRQR